MLAAGLWKTLTDRTSWNVADYSELRETWLFEQGRWLPKSIPESVRDIEGWTNIDDGSVMLNFYIDPRDIGELTAQFRELAPEEFPVMYRSDGESATVIRCFEESSSDSIYVAFIAFEPDSGRCEYHRPLQIKSRR
jgi:hypothetical protein